MPSSPPLKQDMTEVKKKVARIDFIEQDVAYLKTEVASVKRDVASV